MSKWSRSPLIHHKKIPPQCLAKYGTVCAVTRVRMDTTIKKILLVEDHDRSREVLARLIKCLGYEVLEASTAGEAIDRASSLHPSLILMDLKLPGMSGVEATAQLKANPSTRDIPVVISTGWIIGESPKRALDAGAAEILYKPYDLATLRNVLSRYW
jgi:CheY-like chemotaxis protein